MNQAKMDKDDVKEAENSSCQHPEFIGHNCTSCNVSLFSIEYSNFPAMTRFEYVYPGLKLAVVEIIRRRDEDLQHMLDSKRLHLFLDLDHTLIESAALSRKLTDVEIETIQSKKSSSSLPRDVTWDDLYSICIGTRVMKLRKGVRAFLDFASSMFDLSIYTKASRSYAQEVTEILGSSRFRYVISKEDCSSPKIKGLDVVLACQKIVLIVDDTEQVWCNNKDNLVRIQRSCAFPIVGSVDTDAFMTNPSCCMTKNEDDEFMDTELARVLSKVRLVHSMFFDWKGEFSGRDVRPILQRVLQMDRPLVEDRSSTTTCTLPKRKREDTADTVTVIKNPQTTKWREKLDIRRPQIKACLSKGITGLFSCGAIKTE